MGKTLEAETTTGLARTTVHQQYNRKAFGLFFMGRLVPIVVSVKKPGHVYQPSILMFGPVAHKQTPYRDFGVRELCCRQELAFNVRHYVKCYLPNAIASNGRLLTPYTYNLCEACGAVAKDSCGHTLNFLKRRAYRPNKFIWAAGKTLQEPAGRDNIFEYQEGVTKHGC